MRAGILGAKKDGFKQQKRASENLGVTSKPSRQVPRRRKPGIRGVLSGE